MTLRRAERITSCQITVVDNYTIKSVNQGEPISISAPNLSMALEIMVQEVYETNCQKAMERAGWKCERCGGRIGLSCHHRIYRSHGRDDRVENLEVLDSKCHELEHNGRS